MNRKILAKVIQRIIEVAHPDKLILFGSGARDEIGPHSDAEISANQSDRAMPVWIDSLRFLVHPLRDKISPEY